MHVARIVKHVFATLAFALLAIGNAQALLVTSASDDFTTTFGDPAGTGTNTLGATVFWNVQSVSSSTITILVSITNTSVLTTYANAGIESIGLQTAPKATSVGISGGAVFLGAAIDNIPSLNQINLCAFSGNNCNGGGQGGLLAVGASDSFLLTIGGDFTNGLTVLDSGIKFQTSGGSYEETGTLVLCSPTAPACVQQQVPEPSTILLAALGLLLAGFARRQRA